MDNKNPSSGRGFFSKLLAGLSPGEKNAIRICVVAIVLCLIAIALYDVTSGDGYLSSKRIGFISEVSNDIRHKKNGKVFWKSAKRLETIRAGDKVFTGKKSVAKVKLRNSTDFVINENSLVEFREFENEKIPDFSFGTFNVKIKGSVKVMISGKIAELTGTGSEVRISVDKEKNVEMKSFKGTTKMSYESKNYDLTTDVVSQIKNDPEPAEEAVQIEVESTAAEEHASVAETSERIVGLYDIYKKRNKNLALRDDASQFGDSQFLSPPPALSSAQWDLVITADEKLRNEQNKISVTWTAETYPHFVVEVSPSFDFAPSSTYVFWKSNPSIDIYFPVPKTLFVRVRGVDSEYQLSNYSAVSVLTGKLPEPEIINADAEDAELLLPNSKSFVEPTAIKELAEEAQQESEEFVTDPGPGSPARKVAARDPAQLMSYMNWTYPDSKIQIEGGFLNLRTTEQALQGQTIPGVTMLGLRSTNWWGNQGVEGIVKAKVADSSPNTQNIDPLFVEARYKYQFRTQSPLSREIQISPFLGLEYFRNNGSPTIGSGYEVAKVGVTLILPLASRWDLAGEGSYGIGFDSSVKYELGGNLSYYFTSKWSWGFGYKLHFFEAGSMDSTPSILPYREAFEEGFTAIRYHF